MIHWLRRPPRQLGDWLLLILAAALLWQAAAALPAVLRAAAGLPALLAPFGLGLVLAYVLDIPTRFFAARLCGGRRTPAILLSYAALLGALTALVWLVVPQLGHSLDRFLTRLPAYWQTITGLLAALEARLGLAPDALTGALVTLGGPQALLTRLPGGMLGSAGQLAGAAVGAAAGAADVFIAFAVSVYLLAGKESLLRGVRLTVRALLPPRAARSLFAVAALANRTFNGYIGGQLLDALLVGLETFALMAVLGLPYAPLIAVLVGATNIIPVLGPFLGAGPGALLLLLEDPWQAVEFLLVVLAVQQVDGNFIAPRILGGATGLSGLGVLFGILAGGRLFGVPGMLAAVPTLAVLAALARQAVCAGLSARGLDPDTGDPK